MCVARPLCVVEPMGLWSSLKMERQESRKSLVVLPSIKPCGESWADMTGDERVRHCASCDEDVYDLSALSSDEAATFLERHQSALPCLRMAKDLEGTPLFREDLARLARQVAAVGAVATLAACADGIPSVTRTTGEPAVASTAQQAGPASTLGADVAPSSAPAGSEVHRTLGEAMPTAVSGAPAASPPPRLPSKMTSPEAPPVRMLAGKPVAPKGPTAK
jgi:hypothetical protein